MSETPTPGSEPTPNDPTPTGPAPIEPTPITPAPVDTGLQPHVAAGLACIFPIIGSIIFLAIEKRNKFVRFWAMQSLLLGLTVFAVAVLFYIASLVLGHLPLIGGLMRFLIWLLYWPFRIAWVIAYIYCIVKAFSNQEWEIPWLGKIARSQLAKIEGSATPVP